MYKKNSKKFFAKVHLFSEKKNLNELFSRKFFLSSQISIPKNTIVNWLSICYHFIKTEIFAKKSVISGQWFVVSGLWSVVCG
ncbi:hypothetical protein [Capnocytophaga granulosa]|uniref:hypothetical protein n=1 Tax=Capnocytophaga granulosa TaxID=45242 RepID=UPI0011864D71|nr:hypothetical protein [Capnocytophaga granulosa]